MEQMEFMNRGFDSNSNLTVQRATDQEAIPGHLQDPDPAVQGIEESPAGHHTKVGAQGCTQAPEAGAAPQTRHLG